MNVGRLHYTEFSNARSVAAAPPAKPAISVVGLGHAGAVPLACFAHLGFRMVGVDICADRVADIRAGCVPIVERRLEELLSEGIREKRVSATQNLIGAVLETEVTLVSVDVPPGADAAFDPTPLRQVCGAIGQALAMKQDFHVVVLRCPVPPEATLGIAGREIAKSSGRDVGADFGLCYNPQFGPQFGPELGRAGTAVTDFFSPARTVIGASDERTQRIVARIYEGIDERPLLVPIETAEMIKHADTAWQAAKAEFAAELSRRCQALAIDSQDVLGVLGSDLKLAQQAGSRSGWR